MIKNTEVVGIIVTILLPCILVLLLHIFFTLSKIRTSNMYIEHTLDQVQESLKKLYIAKRIEIRQKYNIDLEEFYSKYESKREEAELEEIIKLHNGDY